MEPAALTDYLSVNKMSKAALAFKLGKQRSWLQNLFKQSQARLISYLKIAHYANLTGLELALVIEKKEMAELLDQLRMPENRQFLTLDALAKEIGVSPSLLQILYKDAGSLNGIKSYVDLAREIRCEVEHLCINEALEELSA